ncbi:hypothetical protein Nmel_017702, partial [Mimus melanotis]
MFRPSAGRDTRQRGAVQISRGSLVSVDSPKKTTPRGGCSTAVPGAGEPRDPVAHVEQHHLQRVGVHAPLVGLGGALHVQHHA